MSDLVQEFCHFIAERLRGRLEEFEKSLIGKVYVQERWSLVRKTQRDMR